MYKEWKRQVVHMGLFGIAFGLRWVTPLVATIVLAMLTIGAAWLAPQSRLRLHLFRSHERTYAHGALWYLLTLLVLTIVFPLPIVAASWGVLALGDGMATLIGKMTSGRRLPWNKKKSLIGSAAFVGFGALGCAVLLHWMLPDIGWTIAASLGIRTAVVAAIVESLPWRIDDNVTVPLVSAITLSLLI